MPRVTHGYSNHSLYPVWSQMISRCYSPKSPKFKDYGARGIAVCDEWRTDVSAFIVWAESKGGWKPGLSLDRRENDDGYSPANCAFVTGYEQQNNRRPAVFTELGRSFHSYAVARAGRLRKGIVYQRHSNETALAALRLREQKKTHREISEQLDVPFGGVGGLLARGRKLT